MRHHPHGNVRLEEVEQERMSPGGAVRSVSLLNLVSSSGRPPKRGEELTLFAEARTNDNLLLEAGYLWNELPAAAYPMRLILPHDAKARPTRARLLKEAGLNETQDFNLVHGALPEGIFRWSRISVCTEAELEAASSAEALAQQPLSDLTENAVASNVLTSLQGLRAVFDHEVEEDDFLLEGGLGPREVMAVRHRRLSKMVLDDAMTRAAQKIESAYREEEKRKHELKGGNKGYSSKKERKREEEKRRKKEKQREEIRRKRQEKAAAAAADEAAS